MIKKLHGWFCAVSRTACKGTYSVSLTSVIGSAMLETGLKCVNFQQITRSFEMHFDRSCAPLVIDLPWFNVAEDEMRGNTGIQPAVGQKHNMLKLPLL